MRWRSSGLSLFLLLSIFVLKSATELRICAYNVQKFDSAKASNERLMHYLKLVTHTLLCILYYIFSPAAVMNELLAELDLVLYL